MFVNFALIMLKLSRKKTVRHCLITFDYRAFRAITHCDLSLQIIVIYIKRKYMTDQLYLKNTQQRQFSTLKRKIIKY